MKKKREHLFMCVTCNMQLVLKGVRGMQCPPPKNPKPASILGTLDYVPPPRQPVGRAKGRTK